MNYFELIASVLAGSTFSAVLAKAFISKNLKDLETAIEKIGDIKSELAAIAVRLEAYDKANTILQDLDKKIVALEMVVYGRSKSTSSRAKEVL